MEAALPVEYQVGAFPPQDLDWAALAPLIGPASAGLGRYDGLLRSIPNADVLLSPLAFREAVDSNRIEGTQTTVAAVLQFEAEGRTDDESTPARADQREVLNYRNALNAANRLMQEGGGMSQWLIRGAHSVLMEGVRGRDKHPGAYRMVPAWIGRPGAGQDDADYIACPYELIQSEMDDWEAFLNASGWDVIVQLAIVHAQFEAIHPFEDGNGRVGRLVLPLFLVARGALSAPSFYLSGYLDRHRAEYVERLRAVSRDGDWTGWCAFFLHAVAEQAAENQQQAAAILDLYERRKEWIPGVVKSQHAVRALDQLHATPIFTTPRFIANSGIPSATARRIVTVLRERGIVREYRPRSGRTPALLAYQELLDVADVDLPPVE